MPDIRLQVNSLWVPFAAGAVVLVVGGVVAAKSSDGRIALLAAGIATGILGMYARSMQRRRTATVEHSLTSNTPMLECDIPDCSPPQGVKRMSLDAVTSTMVSPISTVDRVGGNVGGSTDRRAASHDAAEETERANADLSLVTPDIQPHDTIEVPFSTVVGLRPERPTASIRFA